MSSSDAVELVIGIAVLGYILYGQLQPRPIRANMRLPLILGIIGVVELYSYLKSGHHGKTDTVVLALAGSLVIAAVLGGIRAATVRIWFEGGQPWRQGNWLTALLWILSIAIHLGYDYLVTGKGSNSGLGSASLLLYFAVTFTIQRVIMQSRAQRIDGAPPPSTWQNQQDRQNRQNRQNRQ